MKDLVIKDYAEILNRKNFENDQVVTLENFKILISLIVLPDNQIHLTKCQIHKKKNKCNHHFMNGYLIETKNGKEAIIGGYCGDEYFQLNETFKQERNNLRSSLEKEKTLHSIREKLNYIEMLQLAQLENEFKEVAKDVRALIDSYSVLVKQKLINMEKSKNSEVTIFVDYLETDQKGNVTHHWTEQAIGSIKGTYVWKYQENIGHLISLLRQLKQTLPLIQVDKKQKITQLRKWQETLLSIDEITSGIEHVKKEYSHFISAENILLTSLLIKNRDERLKIVETAKLLNNMRQSKENILVEFDKNIRNEFGKRNFRLAA